MSTRELIAFCFVVVSMAFVMDRVVSCTKESDLQSHQELMLRIEKDVKK
jgi:hypothetical protein